MKKAFLSVLLLAALLLCACGKTAGSAGSSGIREITLAGTTAESKTGGVDIKGNIVTISAPGTYSLTGELSDGQIIIDTGEDKGKVDLILDNAFVTNLTGPALWVERAKKLDLIIAGGSVNELRSGKESDLAGWNEGRSGAAIYAEDDIDIETEGSADGQLYIHGYLNSGIVCKDDVEIKCGNCLLNIKAANNGIKGSESVTVSGGRLSIDCPNDGIKSSNAEKEGKGFVAISGGVIELSCGGDGISAETVLRMSGGVVNIKTNGDPDKQSCKALKGKTGVEISGGAVTLDSADHAIHSAAGVELSGGSFEINTAAKGISAHGAITVDGGAFAIDSGDDAIEAYGDVAFNAGSFDIRSGADGIKTKELGSIVFEGGSVSVSAASDPFDASGELLANGGDILAVGRSKTVKSFSDNSTQAWECRQDSGGADTVVIAGKMQLTSAYGFNVVLASSKTLQE